MITRTYCTVLDKRFWALDCWRRFSSYLDQECDDAVTTVGVANSTV
jgi:hypothetical protein